MDWIMIPINCAIIFGCIYKVIELFARRRERMLLISKIAEISGVDFRGISLYSDSKYTALRIGCLLLGIGLGVLVGFLINMLATGGDYTFHAETPHAVMYTNRLAGIVYAACVCLFGGLSLLLSYHTERKAEQQREIAGE